jgi:hypothetical protein
MKLGAVDVATIKYLAVNIEIVINAIISKKPVVFSGLRTIAHAVAAKYIDVSGTMGSSERNIALPAIKFKDKKNKFPDCLCNFFPLLKVNDPMPNIKTNDPAIM